AVAVQHGDLQVDAGLLAGGGHGRGAGGGVDAAGVADDADLLLGDLAQQGCQHVDEVLGEAFLRVLHARAGHDRHGDLGQVVEYQEIEGGAAYQLGGGGGGVAPEGGGA